MGRVGAEVELIFNSTASPDQLPSTDMVVVTLIEAARNPNNAFNLTLDPESIKVLGK